MSHVHNIICSPYINKTLTNQLVQHTRIKAERNARELYTHCSIHIYLKPFEKSNCLTLVIQFSDDTRQELSTLNNIFDTT